MSASHPFVRLTAYMTYINPKDHSYSCLDRFSYSITIPVALSLKWDESSYRLRENPERFSLLFSSTNIDPFFHHPSLVYRPKIPLLFQTPTAHCIMPCHTTYVTVQLGQSLKRPNGKTSSVEGPARLLLGGSESAR